MKDLANRLCQKRDGLRRLLYPLLCDVSAPSSCFTVVELYSTCIETNSIIPWPVGDMSGAG